MKHVERQRELRIKYGEQEHNKIQNQISDSLTNKHFRLERLGIKRERAETKDNANKRFNKRQKNTKISHTSVVTGEVRITLLVAADHTQDINLELEARHLPCLYPQDHNDPKKRESQLWWITVRTLKYHSLAAISRATRTILHLKL
jgi:hypothetical protein